MFLRVSTQPCFVPRPENPCMSLGAVVTCMVHIWFSSSTYSRLARACCYAPWLYEVCGIRLCDHWVALLFLLARPFSLISWQIHLCFLLSKGDFGAPLRCLRMISAGRYSLSIWSRCSRSAYLAKLICSAFYLRQGIWKTSEGRCDSQGCIFLFFLFCVLPLGFG